MEEEGLVAALATWATNAEIQALFLIGCTCVGAWVLLKWIMQMVFHGVKSWYGSTQRQLIFWCSFVLMYFLAVIISESRTASKN